MVERLKVDDKRWKKKEKINFFKIMTLVMSVVTFLITSCFFMSSASENIESPNLVNIYVFHSKSCSHCQEELKMLHRLENKFANVKIYKYEISEHNNSDIYEKVLSKFKINTSQVPLTIIGDKYFIGYSSEKTRPVFYKAILYYSQNGYKDVVAPIVGNKSIPNYTIGNNKQTVEEFIDNYGNYKLFFVSTEHLGAQNINILTTFLTELNVCNVVLIVVLNLILVNLKDVKDKIIVLSVYSMLYVVQDIFCILKIDVVNEIFLLVGLNYFVYSVLLYVVKNKKNHIIYSIVFLMASLSIYFKINYYHKYMDIFEKTIELNVLSNFEYIIQIIISIICSAMCLVIFITLIYGVISIFENIKNRYENKE